MATRKRTTAPRKAAGVAIDSHFENRAPEVRKTYAAIVKAAKALGPVRQEAKKTSIHLVRKSAFAGVATRKDALILTVKSQRDLRSARVVKREQVSANRWHIEVRLREPAEVDTELRAWLAASYALSA